MEKQNDLTERLAVGLGWFSIGLGLTEVLAPGTLARVIGISDNDENRSLLRFYGFRELAAGVGILSQPSAPTWLWSRVGGDLLDIASLGRAMASDENSKAKLSAATAAVLGVTALDVMVAQQLSAQKNGSDGMLSSGPRHFTTSITVNCTPQHAYEYWRNFENFPNFMSNLDSVHTHANGESHWRAKAPAGHTVEWKARMTDDQPGSRIAWESVEGSEITNSGAVRFEQAPGGRGTIIHVDMTYQPPFGTLGAGLAKVMGRDPEQQIGQDLRHLKQILEVGEVVHSDASIHSGMHPAQPAATIPVENMPKYSTEPPLPQRRSEDNTSLPKLAPEVMH